MASTSSTTTPQPAPWKQDFLGDLDKMDSPEFVFSSLHPAPKDSPTPFLPRARYCIFRGFWAELPDNKHNQAPMNERVFESELPTFTSDVRMMKIPQLFASGSGHATKEEQMQGSGGGGPCEAVYWIKETQVQWRLRGEAFVVAPDIEGEHEHGSESSGVRTVKSELGSRMRVVDEAKKSDWSWNKELTAHFGNNSPGLRGVFISGSSFSSNFSVLLT
jgi:pyridoxamine 5'-phosphate oxidase